AFLFRNQISPRVAAAFIAAQVLGGVLGAGAASLMFSANLTALSSVERSGSGSFFGEVVATAGLVILILLLVAKGKANLVAGSVAAWIFAGHVFTSSNSFANPAVT
ncbi:MAG: aquaporin family protein, partial [Aquiluna sp.]